MKKALIIIPARLAARRLPNKPLIKIGKKPMILHVLEKAEKTRIGEVFVTTPDVKIKEIVEDMGGKVILTSDKALTGTDRVFEAFKIINFKADYIINLQGDMPNVNPDSIIKLKNLMEKDDCDIGTLASNLENNEEINKESIVKVKVKEKLQDNLFLKAYDFFRKSNEKNLKNIFHHIGIYCFRKEAIKKFYNLKRSKIEIERNLEQMRALENNMSIKVAFTESNPLSVDTDEDLVQIRKETKR